MMQRPMYSITETSDTRSIPNKNNLYTLLSCSLLLTDYLYKNIAVTYSIYTAVWDQLHVVILKHREERDPSHIKLAHCVVIGY